MVSRHNVVYVDGHYRYSVRTTGQTRVLGIWWQKKLKYIEVSWDDGYYRTCYYSPEYCPLLYPYFIPGWFFSATNKADLEYIFLTTQYSALFDVSYCLATHKGQLTAGGEILERLADALEDY